MIQTRPIPGFPGYVATSDGLVLSKRGEPLRPRPHHRTGHLRVRLYSPDAPIHVFEVDGRVRRARYADVYVHVAVCTAFHGPPPFEGALVCHWDDDPRHNWPENLRWGSRLDNAADLRRNSVDDDGFDWSTGTEVAA